MAIQEAKTAVLSSQAQEGERKIEIGLRPQRLQEFVGQPALKESLGVFLRAAKLRQESLEHVLLSGPPGLGKTRLAQIIARELSTSIRISAGPALTKVADLAGILTNLKAGDVLFIDEIHRLQSSVEEVLYPAMEDFSLDLVVGQGPGARTLRLDLPPFTLVGATTRVGMLGSPLRDRFGMMYRLNFYEVEEMQQILRRSAELLKCEIEEESLKEIAGRCRRTPRIGNRLLKRVRDYVQVAGGSVVTRQATREALSLLEIDEAGLDATDRKVLEIMVEQFEGGPVGLQTLAAMVGEEERTIEEVVEPFLLQCGFIQRTPRGRTVTNEGVVHLG
jgi:Holliday junction DNA helicase RuvB